MDAAAEMDALNLLPRPKIFNDGATHGEEVPWYCRQQLLMKMSS